MELVYMILDEVKRIEYLDNESNSIQIQICHTSNIKFEFIIKAVDKGVLVKYQNLLFNCETLEIFIQVIEYLLKNINKQIENELEFMDYLIDPEDGSSDEYYLCILKENKCIFNNKLGHCKPFIEDITPLFYLVNTNSKIHKYGITNR